LLIAFSLLPERFGDNRHEALKTGLRRAGYTVREGVGAPSDERDLLITWTVHRGFKQQARDQFEAAGGRVVVAEEAHIQHLRNGPYPYDQYFSLCLHDHQYGWPVGGPERWASWNLEIASWRRDGGRVLVREQRGIGSARMASPPGWHTTTARALTRLTARPVEIVSHPKSLRRRGLPVHSNGELFADSWCVVVWASHMGTEALLHGVPVVACAPWFFLSPACGRRLEDVDAPAMPDNRKEAFERFAWAQWAMSEITSGEAFAHLLQ
jgi:hypothetical protein